MFEPSILDSLDGLLLLPAINKCLHVEAMLIIQYFQQIDARGFVGVPLIALSLDALEAEHIGYYFELQTFPVEQPPELLYPLFCLERAGCL